MDKRHVIVASRAQEQSNDVSSMAVAVPQPTVRETVRDLASGSYPYREQTAGL